MKRGFTGLRSSRSVDVPEGEQGFWPSFADMMSSFALIMFFLMLISYLQNLITGNRLTATEQKLTETEQTLSDTTNEVATKSALLSDLQLSLEDAEAALLKQQEEMAAYAATIKEQTTRIGEQQALLAERETALSEQEARIMEQEATLLQQKTLIASQEADLSEKTARLGELDTTIADQEEYIALTTAELTRLREQMQTVAYLRLSILNQIKDSIAGSLEGTSTVSIGDNGSIVLSAGLFFDNNKSDIKPESYELLNNLETAFFKFLSDDENLKYVDSIVISGHTDSSGTDERNRELSAQRANSVLGYLLSVNRGELSGYAEYFCAAGYGATRPVASNNNAEGKAKNRRIEISITLKDESVLEIVDDYLRTEIPQ